MSLIWSWITLTNFNRFQYFFAHGISRIFATNRNYSFLLNLLWTNFTMHYLTVSPLRHMFHRAWSTKSLISGVPVGCVPFRRTSFARRSFSTAAPLTWNSLPPAVLNCDSLSTFNPDLKLICFLSLFANYSTYLFRQRLCSRLTALWRYINFVLLLLLLLLCVKAKGHRLDHLL